MLHRRRYVTHAWDVLCLISGADVADVRTRVFVGVSTANIERFVAKYLQLTLVQ